MKFFISLIPLYCFFASVISQTSQNIMCQYEMTQNDTYTCTLISGNITSSTDPLNITGTHLQSKLDLDVTFIRTLQVSYHGIIIKNFHPQFFEIFPNLDEISLSFVDMEEMDFGTCGNITKLTLHDNFLTEIPNNTFENCSNLKYLEMSFDRIEKIYDDTFKGLRNLEILNLVDNPLLHISNNSLVDLVKLKEFYFGLLGSIEIGALSHMKNLEIIDLFNMNLNFFHTKSLLDGLTNLTVINLLSNFIETENFEFFAQFKKLETLNLELNELTSLPDFAFDGLENLKFLALSFNKISSIPQNSFKSINSLEILRISGNLIDNLISLPFSHLTSLKELDISSNPIKILPNDVFINNQNLEDLQLSRCQLTEITGEIFKPLTKLIKIDFSDNKLTSIPAETFINFPNLQTFFFSGNPIKKLNSNSFGTLQNLETLNFFMCEINEIEPNFFEKFPKLEFFNGIFNECIDNIVEINLIDFKAENVFSQCFKNWENEMRTTEITTAATTTATDSGKSLNFNIWILLFILIFLNKL